MEKSMRLGLMAVVAVSGSMAILVQQVHKRSEKHEANKKVRFSKEALEEKSYGRGDRMITTRVGRIKAEQFWEMENVERDEPKLEKMMPTNRKVLYRGIMKYRNSTIHGRLPF
ncbi:uncharacterized protein LOC124828324 isoform X2 [Vigna umbellata]|uniref:uncharacterized protein LOC124828324 isoform X2 n=1 Tax=Vigna umbellata TaxID=87088 RepID=UPI001F5EBC5C|nr:uncharacterized protein LOC124828324 isoform X2 [Vigna umbellata]